ncbi:DUF4238 domain-containing protein [Priestia megaterium]|uniref:DUF4238 domain-containing protein n=1 Tax=Priestia megaterium TaxID=1404 RepID=UPI00115208C2
MSNQIKRRQHYVPQFYLRQFAFKKKGKNHFIHYYDKILSKEWTDNVKNVAEEHKLYNVSAQMFKEKFGLSVHEGYQEQELENTFGVLEGEWSSVFKVIHDRYKAAKEKNAYLKPFLDDKEKESLSKFIAHQAIRTPSWWNKANTIARFLSDQDEIFSKLFEDFNYDNLMFYMHYHSGFVDRYSTHILENFNWIIAYSEKNLITSDNPLSHVFHLKHRSQYDEINWPDPPYFEEYSIALNPNLLLILAQKDNTHFKDFETEDYSLNNRLHLRYTRHHIISASRSLFYLNKDDLQYAKGIMYRASLRGEDFVDNTKFIVSVP